MQKHLPFFFPCVSEHEARCLRYSERIIQKLVLLLAVISEDSGR